MVDTDVIANTSFVLPAAEQLLNTLPTPTTDTMNPTGQINLQKPRTPSSESQLVYGWPWQVVLAVRLHSRQSR